MKAFLSGQLGLIVIIIFFVLILGGLLVQHFVKKMRWEIVLAEYKAQRGPVEQAPEPPPPEKLLPGYSMLTYDDYMEIEASVKQKLMKELEKRS